MLDVLIMVCMGIRFFGGLVFVFLIQLVGSAQPVEKRTDGSILDVIYTPDDTLRADFYLPANYKQQKNPLLICFGQGDYRGWQHYKDWATLAADQGYVAINYVAREATSKENFISLLDFIDKNSNKFSVDLQQIAVYAGSGNVSLALPVANENSRVKAALMYYGTAEMKSFRIDLPVLLLRAGFDNVGLNKKLDTLAFRALQANAPYTIFSFTTASHPFEDIHDPEKLLVMKASLDFLKMNMRKPVQENFSKNRNEIIAVREMYRSDWVSALSAFTSALKDNPGDNEIERKIGNIYIELKEYAKAIVVFDNALTHGNWRKGEIARQKSLAYAAMNKVDASIAEMRILKKIGWFQESDYTNNNVYNNVIHSEAYRKFLNEQQE